MKLLNVKMNQQVTILASWPLSTQKFATVAVEFLIYFAGIQTQTSNSAIWCQV